MGHAVRLGGTVGLSSRDLQAFTLVLGSLGVDRLLAELPFDGRGVITTRGGMNSLRSTFAGMVFFRRSCLLFLSSTERSGEMFQISGNRLRTLPFEDNI